MAADPTSTYRKQQGLQPITQSYDPKVVGWITQAATATGADPAALLATSLQESGARTGAVGDAGTSFGPFQMHRGGALGSHSPAWANGYGAVLNRAQEFAKGQVHHGKGAAAIQRPQDQNLYAQGVDKYMQQAKAILAHYQGGGGATVPGTAAPKATSLQTNDDADIGVHINASLQALIDSSAQNAGISSIQLPVATPIAPRKTPAPVKVSQDAVGTGAVDQTGQAIVNVARKFIGVPYLWGGTTRKGLDCSALLQIAAKQAGVTIPRTTYQQIKVGKPIAPNQVQPGDAVFFGNATAPHHVGIAIGGGRFIEAPHSGSHVRISTLAGRTDFVAARRYA